VGKVVGAIAHSNKVVEKKAVVLRKSTRQGGADAWGKTEESRQLG